MTLAYVEAVVKYLNVILTFWLYFLHSSFVKATFILWLALLSSVVLGTMAHFC